MTGDMQIILEGRVADRLDRTEALHEFGRLTGQPVERVEALFKSPCSVALQPAALRRCDRRSRF